MSAQCDFDAYYQCMLENPDMYNKGNISDLGIYAKVLNKGVPFNKFHASVTSEDGLVAHLKRIFPRGTVFVITAKVGFRYALIMYNTVQHRNKGLLMADVLKQKGLVPANFKAEKWSDEIYLKNKAKAENKRSDSRAPPKPEPESEPEPEPEVASEDLEHEDALTLLGIPSIQKAHQVPSFAMEVKNYIERVASPSARMGMVTIGYHPDITASAFGKLLVKSSLTLHPDKGGNMELFQELQKMWNSEMKPISDLWKLVESKK